MPYKNLEDRRKNYQKNKEKHLARCKKYYEKNKEHIINKERVRSVQYRQSAQGKKTKKIIQWRLIGIIDEDLSAVYDYLIKQTHCMICLKEYINSKERNLDHDHQTGEIRYICCRSCNTNLLAEKYIS